MESRRCAEAAERFPILLVNVLEERYLGSEDLGLQALAAFLARAGHEVHHERIVCGDTAVFVGALRAREPRLIGFCPHARTRWSVEAFAAVAKTRDAGVWVCAGGNYATAAPRELLERCPSVDVVVLGEGEATLGELVSTLAGGGGVEGCRDLFLRTCGRTGGRPALPSLDALPWPHRDFTRCRGMRVARLSTSRGCRGACSFCNAPRFWRRPRWRGRDPDDVCDEIEHLRGVHGVGALVFDDASFEDSATGSDYAHACAIAERLVARRATLPFSCYLRAESISEKHRSDLALLRSAGLCSAFVGVESGNAEQLRRYRKRATAEESRAALRLLAQLDLHAEAGFIMFDPWATRSELAEDIGFLEEIGFAWSFEAVQSRLEVYAGTALHDRVEREGLLRSEDPHGWAFRDAGVARVAEHVSSRLSGRLLLLDAALSSWSWGHAVMRRHAGAAPILDDVRRLGSRLEGLKRRLAARYAAFFRRTLEAPHEPAPPLEIGEDVALLDGALREFYVAAARKGVRARDVVPDTVLAPAAHFQAQAREGR